MIDAHRGAFEYDWRTRFHKPLRCIGRSMSWGEAIRLTRLLSLDPGSAVGAAVNEFDRPTHRDALVLMDLYDMLNGRGAKRRPPKYPRPWGDKARRRIGRARLDRTQLRALLDAHRTNEIEEG